MTSIGTGAGEATAAVKVEILRTTSVKPHKPIGTKVCQLTSFDLSYLSITHIQRLLIYKGGHQEFDQVEKKLKYGLSVVLEDFYPLAGKIGKDEEGILRVEYDDEMDGVEFTVAAALDIHVEDLMTKDQKITALNEHFPCTGVSNWEGLHSSLLSVQLTKLKDGFALGCAFNHAVVDGNSVWHFMTAWADRCNSSASISVKPFHDRMKARNTRVKLNLPLELNVKLNLPLHVSHRIFSFPESTIDKIRSTVSQRYLKENGKPFSTFQCIAAHVWRAVTRARQLKPNDQTVLTAFANLRNRIDPPVPESYFGNLTQQIIAATTASVLLDGSPKACTSLIQETIEALDSNAIDKHVTNWERNPELSMFAGLGANIVAFGSSPKFKIYATDFGWGKPERVWIGPNQVYDGMVYLHQGKSGGRSIDVDVCLEDEAMKRLEVDEEFHMKDD